jgi:N-methylhydantoinase B/oxoprolinase/acetone carboxylase alpha subunit
VEHLGHLAQIAMNVGDVFVIETPGGGGYGPPGSEAERGTSTKPDRGNQ